MSYYSDMPGYNSDIPGETVEQLLKKVMSGEVVTENTLSALNERSNKPVNSQVVKPMIEEIGLVEDLEGIYLIKYTPIDGAYTKEGKISTNTRMYQTPPIKVSYGDVVYSPKIHPGGDGYCTIAQVDEVGNWVGPIYIGGVYGYIELKQPMGNDMYISISFYTTVDEPTLMPKILLKKDPTKVEVSRRESSVTNDKIDINIDVSAFPIGTQFQFDFGKVTNGGAIFLYGENLFRYSSLSILPNSKSLVIDKIEELKKIRIYKAVQDGNDIEYVLRANTSSVQLTGRILPSYIPTNVKVVSLGEMLSGYWENNMVLGGNNTWACSPIQYTNNFRIKINCDYVTYVAVLAVWDSTLSYRIESDVEDGVIYDLSGVSAWHVQFRRDDRAVLTKEEILNTISVEYVDGTINSRPVSFHDLAKIEATKSNGFGFNPFIGKPFYAHFAANWFITDGAGNKAIASESLEDIDMAARLGFRFIEANVRKNASGDYVCIHGDTSNNPMTFGDEVIDISNNNIGSNIVIANTTTEYMNENIRYNSDIPKYRTRVPLLQEFCKACKENNIGIFAQYSSKESIDMCVQYLGQDNVIVYGPPKDVRDYFKGLLFEWRNTKAWTALELEQAADKFGAPYMCGIGPETLNKLESDGAFDSFIAAMHAKGYLVGVGYLSEAKVRDCLRRGIDFVGSSHEVNPFDSNYECFDINGLTTQFTTNGSIDGGVVTLTEGETIECGSEDIIPMGKIYLTMRFEGSVKVECGSIAERQITSANDESIVISDYILQNDTHLCITAMSETVTITSLVYKTSTC